MWLFTRYGFFSVACARKAGSASRQIDPNLLMVRARRQQHLENLKRRLPVLAGCEIKADVGTDYRFRIFVPKEVWVGAVTELAGEQTWSNFKNEAARFLGGKDQDYISALHRVWETMYDLQTHEPFQ